jgi:hypothetical protein
MAAQKHPVRVMEVEPVAFDMADAGKYVGRSPWFVRRMIYCGRLSGFKMNGCGPLMVLKSEVDKFVAAQASAPRVVQA